MAACDHSILTYGTFGMWGSLLAGGDVIATTGNNPEANTEVIGKFDQILINTIAFDAGGSSMA